MLPDDLPLFSKRCLPNLYACRTFPVLFVFLLLRFPFGELVCERGIATWGLLLFLLLQIFAHVALICPRRFFAFFKITKPFTIAADAGEHFLLPLAAQLQLFVAIGAAGVRLNGEAPAVAAFPIRANQHPAPLAVDVEQELAAVRAFFTGDVIMNVGRVACDHLADEAGCIFSHFCEEGGQTFLPFADALKPLLPLGGERRAFQIGRDEPDELPPLGGGAELLPCRSMQKESNSFSMMSARVAGVPRPLVSSSARRSFWSCT